MWVAAATAQIDRVKSSHQDIDVLAMKARMAVARRELTRVFEEAAVAEELARMMYVKCLDDLNKAHTRLKRAARSWGSLPSDPYGL